MYNTKKFSCIIVDDDANNMETLKKYIVSLPYLELLQTYSDPIIAAKEIALSKTAIDFLLMDIQMQKLSGLALAAMIRHKVNKLIFTATNAKYSLAAYDVLCNHYLLKPFTFQKFTTTINGLIESSKPEFKVNNDRIFIKSANTGKYLNVRYDDIIYINALEHYVVIHTHAEQHIQHTSMKHIAYTLSGNPNFIRVHKSYIISKNHILSVSGNTISLSNNLDIVIGATFKQCFNDFLYRNSLS